MIPSDEICVSARSSAAPLEAAAEARSDPGIALARRALVRGEPIPALAPGALVRYVPPEPTRERLAVRIGAAIDPEDPRRGWVVVEALTPLGRSEVPLHLTVLLDLSDSMYSAPLAALPVLQDRPPEAAPHPVQRIALAREALSDLVDRLPSRAEWSLVAFERDRASTVLPPTVGADRQTIVRALERASPQLARSGARTPLDQAYAVAALSLDGCADRRILLVTDDHARLALDPEVVSGRVEAWAERGIELWTLSLGTLGEPVPKLEALTASGRGVLVRADTLSEAVEPVSAALRASGTALVDPAITVSFGPAVERWQRVDGPSGSGPDRWALPPRLPSGWREVALYSVTLAPGEGGSELASVQSSGASPAPGEWALAERASASGIALRDAPAFVRHRVFALALEEGLRDPSAPWARLEALGRALVREDGAARELQGWIKTAHSGG